MAHKESRGESMCLSQDQIILICGSEKFPEKWFERASRVSRNSTKIGIDIFNGAVYLSILRFDSEFDSISGTWSIVAACFDLDMTTDQGRELVGRTAPLDQFLHCMEMVWSMKYGDGVVNEERVIHFKIRRQYMAALLNKCKSKRTPTEQQCLDISNAIVSTHRGDGLARLENFILLKTMQCNDVGSGVSFDTSGYNFPEHIYCNFVSSDSRQEHGIWINADYCSGIHRDLLGESLDFCVEVGELGEIVEMSLILRKIADIILMTKI